MGMPNVSDSVSAVTTRSSGPDATTRPARSSSAWVKPGGISSTWCVTSTIAGESGSSAITDRVETMTQR